MKRVFYEGKELGICNDLKSAAQTFRNYCVLEHGKKFEGCEDLEGHDDILASLCAREEANRVTQCYNTKLVVNDVDDWYIVIWETQTEGNGNGNSGT